MTATSVVIRFKKQLSTCLVLFFSFPQYALKNIGYGSFFKHENISVKQGTINEDK